MNYKTFDVRFIFNFHAEYFNTIFTFRKDVEISGRSTEPVPRVPRASSRPQTVP